MIDDNNPTTQTVDILKNYVNLKIDITLLSISKKMSNAASYFVFAIIMGFIALFISLFLSLSLATWLATVLHMPGMGNLIVSGIYVIIAIFLIIYREKLILGPIRKVMSESMDFSDLHNKSSIRHHEGIEHAIKNLNKELHLNEESIDQNMQDIKDYYSYEQMRDRFIQTIYTDPKSILKGLLILREVIKSRRKKQ